jgi:hypothetical protein
MTENEISRQIVESAKVAALFDYRLPRMLSRRVHVRNLSKNGEASCSLT